MAAAATQTTDPSSSWSNEQLLRMLLDKRDNNFPTLQLKGGLVEVKRVVVSGEAEPLIEKRYLGRLSNFAKREFEYLNKVSLRGLERVALLRSLHVIPGTTVSETVVRTAWHGLDTLSWAQLLKAQPGRKGQDQPQYCFTRSAPAVLAWVRGVLRSLQTFHSLGFVHCDLLSRNIVIPYTVINAAQRQFELNLDEPRIIDLELCLGPTTHGAWGEPPPRTGFFDNLGNPLSLNPQDRSEHLCPWIVKKQPDDALDTVARGKRKGKDGLLHDIMPGRQYLRDSKGRYKAPDKLFAQLPQVDWGADLFSLGVAVREMIREANFEPGRHRDDSAERYLNELPKRLRSYDVLNGGNARAIPHAALIAEIDSCIGIDAYKRLVVTVPDDYLQYVVVNDSPTYVTDEHDADAALQQAEQARIAAEQKALADQAAQTERGRQQAAVQAKEDRERADAAVRVAELEKLRQKNQAAWEDERFEVLASREQKALAAQAAQAERDRQRAETITKKSSPANPVLDNLENSPLPPVKPVPAKRTLVWPIRASAIVLTLGAVAGSVAYGYNWLKPSVVQWLDLREQAKQITRLQEEAAALAKRQAEQVAAQGLAKAQAQAAVIALQTAHQAVQQAPLGSAQWRKAMVQLTTLCQPAQPVPATQAVTQTAASCTAAFTQIQQNYLRTASQAQQDPWWSKGRFNTEPSEAMRNWLYATRTLADQGLWVAQVNQAMVSTVAATRRIKDLAPSREDRLAGARTLATLATPMQSPSSTYAVTVSPENARALRFDAANLLWALHLEGEGQNGVPLSRQLAPTVLVQPLVQAVADQPNQAAQAMLAYSLLCWSSSPKEAQAMAYFAKAEASSTPAIAKKAKDMRMDYQNGGQLCKK